MESTIKNLAVSEEIETSAKLICLGFGELQNLNQSNDFYFLPFQLLSQGFERLMKSYICLGYWHKNKEYPNVIYLKKMGHNLEELLETILKDYFLTNQHPTLINDKLFLESDCDLDELLCIISDFGKFARYHNFDIITGSKNTGINPKDRWSAFHNKLIFSDSRSIDKLSDWELRNEIYGDLSRHILIVFEKFISALARQFIHGNLGELGKQFYIPLFDLALTHEKDFGNKDYRKNTTKYKMILRKVHKRTFMDFLQRNFNKNYVSKPITKIEFKGEWPFYAEKVTIECRYRNWCVVTIDGYDYALNGSAKGRYKLENVHEAGMAILGKSVGDLITMALALGKTTKIPQ